MQRIFRIVRTFFKQAVRSVAFLPVPMILAAVLLGFLFFWLENNTEISVTTVEIFEALAITSQDTARTILGMFIGGLITLTVFTFSQIMILLNQVASSYSPRLLPKLTGDRALQFVMGLNLSTIVLSITVLLSIRSEDNYKIPNFSILVCTVLGIVCLCLFVYFVTAITRKIQVDSIIDSTARDALDGLAGELKLEKQGYAERPLPREVYGWYAIPSPISGYVGTVDHAALSRLGTELNTRFYIGVSKGQYVPRGLPLLQSEHHLAGPQVQKVLSVVAPIRDQFDDWYLPNLKQLTEIALKAMSPGINDPGTALMVVDRQTEVLARLMQVPMHNYCRADGGREVWLARHNYRDILTTLMQEMRTYSKQDPAVVRSLFQMLYHLIELSDDSVSYYRYIDGEIRALLTDVRQSITNPHDRCVIASDILAHRRTLRRTARLTLLDTGEEDEKLRRADAFRAYS